MTKRLPPVVEQELRSYRKEIRAVRKALAEQAIVHRREISSLATQYIELQDSLRYAIGLIRHLRDQGPSAWTVADDQRVKEWIELVRLAGAK